MSDNKAVRKLKPCSDEVAGDNAAAQAKFTSDSTTKVLELIQDVTQNYAPHRPIDKYIVTRVLQIIAQAKGNPDQGSALVGKLQDLATRFV